MLFKIDTFMLFDRRFLLNIGGHELSKSTGNAGARVACGEFFKPCLMQIDDDVLNSGEQLNKLRVRWDLSWNDVHMSRRVTSFTEFGCLKRRRDVKLTACILVTLLVTQFQTDIFNQACNVNDKRIW